MAAVPVGWGLLACRRLLLGSCGLLCRGHATKRRRPLSCPHLVALCRCPEPPAGHGELWEVAGGVGTCSRGVCSQPGCRAQRPTRPYGTRVPAPVCAITTLNTGTLPKLPDFFFSGYSRFTMGLHNLVFCSGDTNYCGLPVRTATSSPALRLCSEPGKRHVLEPSACVWIFPLA